MGVERAIRFEGEPPGWHAARERLASRGIEPQMRMIDGEIALPEDTPPDSWRELRVAIDARMVTVRRAPHGVTAVAWGDPDERTTGAFDAVTWAFAAAGNGVIDTDEGERSAEDFGRERLPG